MNLSDFFKKVCGVLQNRNVRFAVAGGLAASIYRESERMTNDLDFLILSDTESGETAVSIISQFNLNPVVVRKADLEGGPMFAIKRKNTPPCIVVGRSKAQKDRIGLDFILPEMPWFDEAIQRAQLNEIDFGFGAVPCLTKEDVIISKLYSLRNDSKRFNDWSVLKTIFKANNAIDLAYISGQMQKLKLTVPVSLKENVPPPIMATSKRVLRGFNKK